MKKILLSLGTIVFVGSIAAAATGAFFNDTETSTGNTFAAGAIDLKIDSVAHYNGMVCASNGEDYIWVPEDEVTLDEDNQPVIDVEFDADAFNAQNPAQFPQAGVPCIGTWPVNVDGNSVDVDTFWSFNDLKPGDNGENTISIHIDNNDAWMCAGLADVSEADNGQTEPESDVDEDGDEAAELDNNLHFFAWIDIDGDNIFDEGEQPLGDSVSAAELTNGVWALADSTTGGVPIAGDSTQYIGVAWCAGDIEISGNSITCNGEGMGNEAQTDSWSTDLSFYVEQSRNNPNFSCAEHFDQGTPEQPVQPV